MSRGECVLFSSPSWLLISCSLSFTQQLKCALIRKCRSFLGKQVSNKSLGTLDLKRRHSSLAHLGSRCVSSVPPCRAGSLAPALGGFGEQRRGVYDGRPACGALPGLGLPRGSASWGSSGRKTQRASRELAVGQPACRGSELAPPDTAGQLPAWEKLAEGLAPLATGRCPGWGRGEGGESDITSHSTGGGHLCMLPRCASQTQ